MLQNGQHQQPDGYSSDTTNLGSKDVEKTDKMSKWNVKTIIINVCKSTGCINEQT